MQQITIGSDPSNDFRPPQNINNISRYHAIIRLEKEQVLIEDLDSTNGTYVNGLRIRRAILNPKDVILIAGQYDLKKDKGFNQALGKLFKQVYSKYDPNDYSEEFNLLREMYDNYLLEREIINQKSQQKTSFKKFGIVSIPLITLALFHGVLNSLYLPLAITAGQILNSLALFLIKDKGKDVKLKQAEVEFRSKYRCPKSQCGYQLRESWELHRDQRVCPNCGVTWSKSIVSDF